MSNDTKLPWGISLLIIGAMFLFREMDIFPVTVENFIFDWKNILILLGIVFLIFYKKKRIGSIILIAIGLFFYFGELIRWEKIADFIWPLLIIVLGGVLVYAAIIQNKNQGASNVPTKEDGDSSNKQSLNSKEKLT